ncbi:hypothetical protein [Dyella tabacisoli]|uniref:Uncharacterized protein n=1 Tax=Dyella tabacisoli TaxID=2282381 RepID=A0A369UI90_9GAMM|nr:hypothetical protein [Dyella tabacisoli]RDD80472.1 hypothetical protein DVJ77_16350 [Dyella tabacisoli]
MHHRWAWLLGLLLVAAPLSAQDIPPNLRDWQGWVLHDEPQHACPFLANQSPGAGSYQCAWPGRLTLDAGKDGGRFSLDVHVDAASWVALPGDEYSWPQQVSVNNKPLPVLNRNDEPMLWLEPGDYTLHGSLPWDERPAQLRVPTTIGLVALNLDGAVVSRIERNDDQLALGEAAAAQRVADALSLRVYRNLKDGLPALLETQLQLNVTGSAREQLLGPALPKGFIATSLQGDLPARLESDGRLRVQLRPGQWTVHLSARSTELLSKISLSLPAEPWPRQEIWSYVDNAALRSTHVQGQATDAAQAGVPEDWRESPAFALDDSSGLSIEQGARGGEGGQSDQVRLQRQLWLDFDGRGFSVADHLSGTLRHRQRLDVAAPWQLQRAAQADTPLLVTVGSAGQSGVELREPQLDLNAGMRLPERGGAIPSAGWQLPLESINATLHLPFGYRLIGASGADRSPDSWIAQWSLLDLFIVALIALLAGRLLGWPWALLAVGFLALSQHESGAPRWTLGVALALALLLRALPEGRLRLTARIGAAAMLALTVLWTLPFAAAQMNYALHPQLEGAVTHGSLEVGLIGGLKAKQEVVPVADAVEEANAPEPRAMPTPPPPPPAPSAPPAQAMAAAPAGGYYANSSKMQSFALVGERRQASALSSVVVTGSRISSAQSVSQQTDIHSVIQAGGGMPTWNTGNNYRLGWSGPVTAEQSSRLVIAPAWLVRLLRVLMLGLLIVLLGKIVLGLLRPSHPRSPGWRIGSASAVLLALALLPHGAQAQSMPSDSLLNQLRTRLTEAPKCAPTCAAVAQANVQASGDTVGLELEAHIGAPVALALPQVDEGLRLLSVSVDGRADAPLTRLDEQVLVRLDRGVHRVALRYQAGAVDTASLHFAQRPQRITFSGQGWSLDGVDAGRPLGDSIALNRVRVAVGNKAADSLVQTFPPYIRLTRSLVLGVDWTVENTVERIAPLDGGFSLELPLLPGEHPLGDNVRVQDGHIGVTFNAGQSEVSWSSRLDHTDQGQASALVLKAPALSEHAEVWELHVAPIWHVDAQGVPASDSDDGLRFQPLPGESLKLAISRPKAAAGASLAFDSVLVDSTVGDRATETRLRLNVRSTRGGEHPITLPAGAELLQASRDGDTISLAVRDGKLSLPLLPGLHRYELRVREPQGVAIRTYTSQFALNATAANIDLSLKLPTDRWVLWTWGPTAGPAVLYWSQLIVLLLAAWLLARYAPTPLRFHHWLLLGLGFSAFAWTAYALVVVWLILLGLRARGTPPARLGRVGFNLLQIGLAAMTLLALAVLISAVPEGLLGLPNMHVAGNRSSAWDLNWFADQIATALPRGGVFSVSLWAYKIAMLAWALWLANALIGWLRWGFEAWTRDGYWRRREPKVVLPAEETSHD